MVASIYVGGNTNAEIVNALNAMQSVTTTLVPNVAGIQASATPLTGMYNEIPVVGGAGAAVALPLAVAGLEIAVVSLSATSMQVFGSGTDTINGVATATGVAMVGAAAGKTSRFICTKSAPAGTWRMTAAA